MSARKYHVYVYLFLTFLVAFGIRYGRLKIKAKCSQKVLLFFCSRWIHNSNVVIFIGQKFLIKRGGTKYQNIKDKDEEKEKYILQLLYYVDLCANKHIKLCILYNRSVFLNRFLHFVTVRADLDNCYSIKAMLQVLRKQFDFVCRT